MTTDTTTEIVTPSDPSEAPPKRDRGKVPFWMLKPEKPNYRPPELGPRPKGGADFLPVSFAVRLCSVQSFAKELGISKASCIRALHALDVPVWNPGDGPTIYFNLPTLEAALYAILRPSKFLWRRGTFAQAELDTLQKVDLVKEMETVAAYYHHWNARAMRRRLRRLARHMKELKNVVIVDEGKTGAPPGPKPASPTPVRSHLTHKEPSK